MDQGVLVRSTSGRLAGRWSRPVAGTIKTGTVSREADGWYGGFSCREVPTQPVPLTGRATGIAVGVNGLRMAADGEHLATPGPYRQAETVLAKAQKRLWGKKKGSKRH